MNINKDTETLTPFGKILILSRRVAKVFSYDKPWACISIASHPDELPKLNSTQRIDLLQLVFDDVEYIPAQGSNRHLISETQAEEIIKFAQVVWPNIDLLMIHCYAGISRSPAIGKFLSEIYQPEYAVYFDQIYAPNTLVYRILKESFEKK